MKMMWKFTGHKILERHKRTLAPDGGYLVGMKMLLKIGKAQADACASEGSALWLYNCYSKYTEIDVWETDGQTRDWYQNNYWWQIGNTNCCAMDCSSERHQCTLGVFLENLSGQPYYLDANWSMFGVIWTGDSIKYLLNNTLIRTIKLPGSDCSGATQVTNQMNLRLGDGGNSIGNLNDLINASNLPEYFQIDYVRAYKKAGTYALQPITTVPTQICNTGSVNITVPYFPDVTYSWSGAAFNITGGTTTSMSATVKSGYSGNQTLTLVGTFPGGYVETQNFTIYIANAVPPTPPTISKTRIGTSCYYQAHIAAQSNVLYYWWKIGSTWEQTTSNDYGELLGPETISVSCKTENACGQSSVKTNNVTIPSPPPGCQYKVSQDYVTPNVSDIDLDLSPNPVSNNLRVNCSNDEILSNAPYDITDMLGRKIAHGFVLENNSILNLSELPAGIYFLTIRNDNFQFLQTKKIIKSD